MTLQNLCVESAARYHQFLEENNLGLIDIAVREKSPLAEGLWKLVLTRRIFDVDTIQLKVFGRVYDTQEGGHFSVDRDAEKQLLSRLIRIAHR